MAYKSSDGGGYDGGAYALVIVVDEVDSVVESPPKSGGVNN